MIHLVEHLLYFLGPDKGFGVCIVKGNIFFYGSHQLTYALEDSPTDPFSRDLSEPAFH